jgi:hypothetical protein
MKQIIKIDKQYLMDVWYNKRKVSIQFDLEIERVNDALCIPHLDMLMYDDGAECNLTILDLDKLISENYSNECIRKGLLKYYKIYTYNGKRVSSESVEHLYEQHINIDEFDEHNDEYIDNSGVTTDMIYQHLQYLYIHNPSDLIKIWNRGHTNMTRSAVYVNNFGTLREMLYHINDYADENHYSTADKYVWLWYNQKDERYIQSFTDLNILMEQLYTEIKVYTDRYCNFIEKLKNKKQ